MPTSKRKRNDEPTSDESGCEMKENDEMRGERLDALLGEAYPEPKAGMRERVEKKIAIEKARRKRALFVRWGSIAACVVLVGGLALSVLLSEKAKTATETIAADTADVVTVYSLAEEAEKSKETPMGFANTNGTEAYSMVESSAVNDLVMTIEEEAFDAQAFYDVNGDGESELLQVKYDEDGGELVIAAEVGGEQVETRIPFEKATLNFENDGGRMLLRAAFSDGEVRYYTISWDGEFRVQ